MYSVSTARDARIDALRGLLLVIMAAVHVPTPLSHYLQEPAGFTSAAEGFLFIGACMAGLVYSRAYERHGWSAMSWRAWNRTRQIYCLHMALVMPMALIAWAVAPSVLPLSNHFHSFLEHPCANLLLIPALLHQPPLFDILPLYVLFLGATPLVLSTARRFGWTRVIAASALGWLSTQFGLDTKLLSCLRLENWLSANGGSFNLLAWQFLWVGGLATGEALFRQPDIHVQRRTPLLWASGGIVCVGLLMRHGLWPQEWFSQDLYLWMDKWTLGPLRLLNFSAWVVLLGSWNPRPPHQIVAPLALLGRHSLAVFALHVPLAIAATIVVETCSWPQSLQTLIGLEVIASLFLWANWLERRSMRTESAPKAPLIPSPTPGRNLVASRS
jgi:hypothetical protein